MKNSIKGKEPTLQRLCINRTIIYNLPYSILLSDAFWHKLSTTFKYVENNFSYTTFFWRKIPEETLFSHTKNSETEEKESK